MLLAWCRTMTQHQVPQHNFYRIPTVCTYALTKTVPLRLTSLSASPVKRVRPTAWKAPFECPPLQKKQRVGATQWDLKGKGNVSAKYELVAEQRRNVSLSLPCSCNSLLRKTHLTCSDTHTSPTLLKEQHAIGNSSTSQK